MGPVARRRYQAGVRTGHRIRAALGEDGAVGSDVAAAAPRLRGGARSCCASTRRRALKSRSSTGSEEGDSRSSIRPLPVARFAGPCRRGSRIPASVRQDRPSVVLMLTHVSAQRWPKAARAHRATSTGRSSSRRSQRAGPGRKPLFETGRSFSRANRNHVPLGSAAIGRHRIAHGVGRIATWLRGGTKP